MRSLSPHAVSTRGLKTAGSGGPRIHDGRACFFLPSALRFLFSVIVATIFYHPLPARLTCPSCVTPPGNEDKGTGRF